MRNFEITVPSWSSLHYLKLLITNDEVKKLCVLTASAGTKSSVKQKSRNDYVHSKCKLCVCVCVCVCSTLLHFYFLFVVKYSIWLRLSVFLNYPCTHLPTIAPDNRQYTIQPTITSYNIWCICFSNKLIAKMKQSNCSSTKIGSEVYARGKWSLNLLGTPCLW